jgi:hypothetical protein
MSPAGMPHGVNETGGANIARFDRDFHHASMQITPP